MSRGIQIVALLFYVTIDIFAQKAIQTSSIDFDNPVFNTCICDSIAIIEVDSLVLSRRCIDKKRRILSEFLRITPNLYHFIQYDSKKYEKINYGNLKINPDNTHIDTIMLPSGQAYEESWGVYLRYNWIKEGLWFEQDTSSFRYGKYRNGKKQGEWSLYNQKNKYGTFAIFEQDSVISETPHNILLTKEIEKIKQLLVRKWVISNPNAMGSKYLFMNGDKAQGYYSEYMIFNKNGAVNLFIQGNHGRKEIKGNYTILSDGNIVLKGFEKMNYSHIKYLSREELEIE